MIVAYILINSLAALVLQLSIAAIFLRIPSRCFRGNSRLSRVSHREVTLYRNVAQIRRWKHLLPNGSAWFGLARSRDTTRRPASLRRFLIETRRSEAAHWLMLACCPAFLLWNPLGAWPILAFYAAVANVPCIVAQRYNRSIALRILERVSRQRSSPLTASS